MFFKKIAVFLLLALALALALSPSAGAEPMSSSLSFGYKTYFQHHPPQDKPVRRNLYPFPGAIIQSGEDIPICAAAKTAAAYARKKGIKYLMHGKNGWIFRSADFKVDFIASPAALEYFRRLNHALASRGQTLVIAPQPTRAMMAGAYTDPADRPKEYTAEKARAGYKSFLQQLSNVSITTADLSETPKNLAYFSKGDFRWTSEGAAHSAQTISDIMKKISVYEDIEKKEFKSEIIGVGTADRGVFEEFIQQVCGINIELTTEPVWSTKAVTENSQGHPLIAVIGDSNVAEDEKFNFVGALKRFSRADIYNAGLPAGGFGSSAYEYFSSETYHAHPPKIIVWEFPAHHDYNSTESLNDFRQMIPAVYGACGEKEALAQYSKNIVSNQMDLFTDNKKRFLKNSYLYLEAAEPEERSLRVEILYKNGDADQIDFPKDLSPANNGKYYLEFSNAEKTALLFRVITDVPQGHLTARICPYPLHIAGK